MDHVEPVGELRHVRPHALQQLGLAQAGPEAEQQLGAVEPGGRRFRAAELLAPDQVVEGGDRRVESAGGRLTIGRSDLGGFLLKATL